MKLFVKLSNILLKYGLELLNIRILLRRVNNLYTQFKILFDIELIINVFLMRGFITVSKFH